MLLYIIRLCLGFNLIRCLCVTIELAYLGVGRNEFICNQWEERNAYRCSFLYDFFELYIDTNAHLQLNTSVHPSWGSNLQQARHY